MTTAACLFAGLLFASLDARATTLAREDPPADSRWVEGRVERPANTPADERAIVVADATGAARFGHHEAACADDGRFRVAFAPDAKAGWLRLEARYLYLERDLPWRAEEPAPEGGFVLKPLVGGVVRGRLTKSAGASSAVFPVGARVEFLGTPLVPGANPIERAALVAADGTFECGGLAPDHEWNATLVAPGFVPLVAESLSVSAGVATDLAWTLRHGAQFRGRVVDEAGAPIVGADVDVLSEELLFVRMPVAVGGHKKTDARGEFTWTGVAPGRATISVTHFDHWPAQLVVEGVREDETRTDLVVTLPSGNVLSGRALDPDGQPAAGARVRVVQRLAGGPPIERETQVGADGAFRFGGLQDGLVTVEGVLERADAPVEPATPGRVEVRAPRPKRWKATLDGVAPNRRDVELRLMPGLTVRGRVFDDLGRTIVRYKAGARRAVETDPHAIPVLIDVENADGRFELEDLTPGEWDVFTYGRGIIYAPARRVTVPYTGEDLVFAVRRPARVSGVVLDASRAPVPKALVQVEWDRAQLLGGALATETTSVTAAADGRFELTEVYPGSVRVLVTPVSGRKSKPFPLELSSGEEKSNVEIVLPP